MIRDYRVGEIEERSPDHVDRWAGQFPDDVQIPLLAELKYVFESTYFSREVVRQFADDWLTKRDLVGPDPAAFWTRARFLRIQQHGESQDAMLAVFDEALRARLGISVAQCGSDGGPYIYLDDVIFSGKRVRTDLGTWIVDSGPREAVVHVLVIASHALGRYEAEREISERSSASGKRVTVIFGEDACFENRLANRDRSEVLWPTELPDDAAVAAYVAQEQRYPFQARIAGGDLYREIFSSEEGRRLLEREFLLAGVRIRGFCQAPEEKMRPLGYSAYGVGFGSLIATFRNCPNNAPLALWWGDPDARPRHPLAAWYPLLPRKYSGNGGSTE